MEDAAQFGTSHSHTICHSHGRFATGLASSKCENETIQASNHIEVLLCLTHSVSSHPRNHFSDSKLSELKTILSGRDSGRVTANPACCSNRNNSLWLVFLSFVKGLSEITASASLLEGLVAFPPQSSPFRYRGSADLLCWLHYLPGINVTLLIMGDIQGHPMILANRYAPYLNDPAFLLECKI